MIVGLHYWFKNPVIVMMAMMLHTVMVNVRPGYIANYIENVRTGQ